MGWQVFRINIYNSIKYLIICLYTVKWFQVLRPHTNHHHHHHVVLVARISLILSRHSSLSFIALDRSSGQHPVSSHIQVRRTRHAGHCWRSKDELECMFVLVVLFLAREGQGYPRWRRDMMMMYVRAGRPVFARPCVGSITVHHMSSSLLLQQWPACLVRLTWIVFVIGGRWPYSWCLVGCCRQDCSQHSCVIAV